ncbi:apolipoprotein N-acyltransferase [Arenimonas sp. MALMAid1274]|uniref:apolipoprotein N-acyltransferase n=1 Tax=Arenimonas sp. MALMAid1274 TaxID=3411630 RepID=UPI003BA23EB6
MERLPPSRWRHLAAVVLSAVLLGLYARGGPAWMLGFVALVPWLMALEATRTLRGSLASAVLMAVGFVAAVFAWFGAAIGGFTGIGVLPGTAVLLVLAPLMQPQLLAYALARQLAARRHGAVLRALAGASAWVGCEWLLPKLLGDTLGHGLAPSAAFRQAADLGGAAGLSLVLILVNEAVAAALQRRAGGLRAMRAPLGAAAALVAALGLYGAARLATLQVPPPDAPMLRVAMIQASITDYERLRQEIGTYGVVRKVLDTHFGMSQSAVIEHGADVLLWSETVYPTTFGKARSQDGAALDQEIQAFVDVAGVPLVFGTYDRDELGEYNAAAFLEPGAGLMGFYRKTHPFPLTEHVPAWMDSAWLRRLLPWTGSWQPGSGARVLPLRARDGREVNVVPLICLDDVRPGLAIDGARLGAQAIIGLSNDSWFTGYPAGARLHLSVAAFRSIETRLPQVRVTTNGLSAIVDSSGEVLASTGIGDQAVLTAELSARDPAPTLMVRWGDWVGRAGMALLLVLMALAAWRKLRLRSDDPAAPVYSDTVALLAPGWRWTAAALRGVAGLALAWIAVDMLLRRGLQVQSLSQLRIFGLGVVLPLLGAWAIQRLFAARVRIADGRLWLDQRRQQVSIPLASIQQVKPWRLPLPRAGVDLALSGASGWRQGLAGADALRLEAALAAAGAPVHVQAGAARGARMAHARALTRHRWLDHGLVKFVLFPLLPAAVAFRLHQVIAFGGPLGEFYTHGPLAWATGAVIWWASWSIGLMLLAAVLRLGVEAGSLLALALAPARLVVMRDGLQWLARAIYYLGVPAWLALRLLSD